MTAQSRGTDASQTSKTSHLLAGIYIHLVDHGLKSDSCNFL